MHGFVVGQADVAEPRCRPAKLRWFDVNLVDLAIVKLMKQPGGSRAGDEGRVAPSIGKFFYFKGSF